MALEIVFWGNFKEYLGVLKDSDNGQSEELQMVFPYTVFHFF